MNDMKEVAGRVYDRAIVGWLLVFERYMHVGGVDVGQGVYRAWD